MLNHLTVDQIRQIADLSNECRAIRDNILNKTYQTDLEDVSRPQGERNPTSFDSLEVVEICHPTNQFQTGHPAGRSPNAEVDAVEVPPGAPIGLDQVVD